jgi:UPF0716 family protein affecting phage T7 exclusion
MPYVLLAIGILLGLYGLYRFFVQANSQQIVTFFMVGGFVTICAAIFFMAITGRLAPAIGLLVALAPFISAFWKKHVERSELRKSKAEKLKKSAGPMTREEALEILGLEGEVTEEEIEAAYKKLIKKVHPDQEGSDWLATKLNEARDFLLK